MFKLNKTDIIILVLTFLLATIVQEKVSSIAIVRGASMEHTLHDGDLLLISKSWLRNPATVERGDIVVVQLQEGDTKVVKRVVGVAGDHVDIKDGVLYLNNALTLEDYTQGKTRRYSDTVLGEVPEGHVYVLGDNREFSYDSRDLGFISVDRIYGVWSGVKIKAGFIRDLFKNIIKAGAKTEWKH